MLGLALLSMRVDLCYGQTEHGPSFDQAKPKGLPSRLGSFIALLTYKNFGLNYILTSYIVKLLS